jgi:transposase
MTSSGILQHLHGYFLHGQTPIVSADAIQRPIPLKTPVAIAKSKGAYKGRKPSLTGAQKEQIRSRVAMGEKKTALAQAYGVSRETIYQALKEARMASG